MLEAEASGYSRLVTAGRVAELMAAKNCRIAAEVVVADIAAGVATGFAEALVSPAAHMVEAAVATKYPDAATAQGRCTAHPPFHRTASRRADERKA